METRVAVFIDFENIKRAVDDHFVNERVDLKRMLDEINRVSEGRITIKRAYADWGTFKDYRSDLLDNATEPVQAFALTYKGKNGADIRIAIDAMDVVLRQKDITHVALVSGDSDFTPLVMKLREFGHTVIGLGVRSNTSTYLSKSCDIFSYYDDLQREESGSVPERSVPSEPLDPTALLAMALAALGNRAVPGSALKMQMRKIDRNFDETRHGANTFLEFLRAHDDTIDLYKPAVGDVSVAPKGFFEANGMPSGNVAGTSAIAGGAANANANGGAARSFNHPGYTPYVPSNGIPYQAPPPPPAAPMSKADRYRLYLRDNNFRYVPSADRHEIMRVIFDVFADAEEDGDEVSLKEAKDRVHLAFEENRPSIPWESINSTCYHLFYTWCFQFDRSEEDNRQLWDRPTSLQTDINTADELISKCERGIVRKFLERDRNDVDPEALNAWLYDGDPDKIDYVTDLIRAVVAAPAAFAGIPR